MIRKTHVLGQNLITCDVCGCKYLSSEIMQTWDGRLTCKKDFNEKHPQLTVKPMKETSKVQYHSNPPDQFAAALTLTYTDDGT